jgi:tryptophanyl-tRNA synthetase
MRPEITLKINLCNKRSKKLKNIQEQTHSAVTDTETLTFTGQNPCRSRRQNERTFVIVMLTMGIENAKLKIPKFQPVWP